MKTPNSASGIAELESELVGYKLALSRQTDASEAMSILEDSESKVIRLQQRIVELEAELRRVLDIVCVDLVIESGDAEIQCPIKDLCQLHAVGLHVMPDSYIDKIQAEKSLKRRKRAPETVGGK